jgi:hypothetical protein
MFLHINKHCFYLEYTYVSNNIVRNIAREKTFCRNPPVPNFTNDRKKLDRYLTDQHVSMLRFYENTRRSIFFVDTAFWQGVFFLAQLSSKCRNPSLTNCVGYDRLLLHGRYVWRIWKLLPLGNDQTVTFFAFITTNSAQSYTAVRIWRGKQEICLINSSYSRQA